jgi:hypothetical protein
MGTGTDATPPKSSSAPFVVALIAGAAAVAWCLLVLPEAGVPLLLFAVPASALLWFWISLDLEATSDARRRLRRALGLGLVSPLPGLALAWLPSWCCVSPCLPGLVAAAMLAHLWRHPWLWLPFGVAMGLVAHLVVSFELRRRAPNLPPQAAP